MTLAVGDTGDGRVGDWWRATVEGVGVHYVGEGEEMKYGGRLKDELTVRLFMDEKDKKKKKIDNWES